MSSPKTVQQWLALVGGVYYPSDPFASQYPTIAVNEKPAKAPAGTEFLIEACLRYRGIIYWKSKPGDCGTATKQSAGAAAKTLQLSEAALGTTSALSTGGVIALGAGVSAALGVATLGIGLAAAPILAITQHHAQAVKTEQATICGVTQQANQTIPAIDAAVASGQISAAQGVDYMNSLCNNLLQGLDTIKKTCNAACVYEAVLRAHLDFASIYYPAIAPQSNLLNGLALPATSSSLAPASAAVGVVTNRTPATPTLASSLSSFGWLLPFAAILIIFILLVR
jgi:hypothetical protein